MSNALELDIPITLKFIFITRKNEVTIKYIIAINLISV